MTSDEFNRKEVTPAELWRLKEGGISDNRAGSSRGHDGKDQSQAENECHRATRKPTRKKMGLAVIVYLCQDCSC